MQTFSFRSIPSLGGLEVLVSLNTRLLHVKRGGKRRVISMTGMYISLRGLLARSRLLLRLVIIVEKFVSPHLFAPHRIAVTWLMIMMMVCIVNVRECKRRREQHKWTIGMHSHHSFSQCERMQEEIRQEPGCESHCSQELASPWSTGNLGWLFCKRQTSAWERLQPSLLCLE